MQAMEMLDRERGNQKSSLFLQPLKVPRISIRSRPKLNCVGGIHYAYEEIMEAVYAWNLGVGWDDSFSNQITERFQESKKALHVEFQVSSHCEVIEVVPTWMLDGGGGNRFQELNKALHVVPQLPSHCKVIEGVPTGIHHACKEMDTKIIEEMPPWILDSGWVDSFSIQNPDRIQELKKALYAVPQLSSHPKPGCLGGFFSSFDKCLQRIIPGYQQTKKVEEWSWRLAPLNILPEVRSQGHYETCVFFAVIGAVEGRYRLHMIRSDPDHVTVPQLSVQDAIDGIKQVPIDPAKCLNWIIKQGVVPESDCPYIGVPQGGHVLKEGRLSVVNGYRLINPWGECAEVIVKEIMEGGPIVGIILYQSEYLHAVMLIGGVYKDGRVDEYVIQNSWGTGWEEDGRGLVPISYLVGAYVPVLG